RRVVCGGLAPGVDAAPAGAAAAGRAPLARADFEEGESPVALSFPWRGDPAHARLHAVAAGICAALPRTLQEELPLVLLIDGDVGKSLGRIIRHEIAPSAGVTSIDGGQLKEFGYHNMGSDNEITNEVLIITKSLLSKKTSPRHNAAGELPASARPPSHRNEETPMPAKKSAKKPAKKPARKPAGKMPPPRVSILAEEGLTAVQRALLDSIRSGPRGGSTTIRGPFAVFLHAPAFGELAQQLGGYCRFKTGVSPRLS